MKKKIIKNNKLIVKMTAWILGILKIKILVVSWTKASHKSTKLSSRVFLSVYKHNYTNVCGRGLLSRNLKLGSGFHRYQIISHGSFTNIQLWTSMKENCTPHHNLSFTLEFDDLQTRTECLLVCRAVGLSSENIAVFHSYFLLIMDILKAGSNLDHPRSKPLQQFAG